MNVNNENVRSKNYNSNVLNFQKRYRKFFHKLIHMIHKTKTICQLQLKKGV